MSQDQIKRYLKAHPNNEYSAEQLKKYLNLGQSIYTNLKKLRNDIKSSIEPNLYFRWRSYKDGRAYRVYWYCPTDCQEIRIKDMLEA
ncbi:MAG: hypothetical protein ACTSX6_04620 [Candidatus Heimdallarchaeaceae archaeon]